MSLVRSKRYKAVLETLLLWRTFSGSSGKQASRLVLSSAQTELFLYSYYWWFVDDFQQQKSAMGRCQAPLHLLRLAE